MASASLPKSFLRDLKKRGAIVKRAFRGFHSVELEFQSAAHHRYMNFCSCEDVGGDPFVQIQVPHPNAGVVPAVADQFAVFAFHLFITYIF